MKLIIRYRSSIDGKTDASVRTIDNVTSVVREGKSYLRVVYMNGENTIRGMYGVGAHDCCMGYEIERTPEEMADLKAKQAAKAAEGK